MRIAGREKVREFQKTHAGSIDTLNRWVEIVEAAIWKTPAKVKATFRSADFIAGKWVFNIGGNKYRLIASMNFQVGLVLVLYVLTHEGYDKDKWK